MRVQARDESCLDRRMPLAIPTAARPEFGQTVGEYFARKHARGEYGRFFCCTADNPFEYRVADVREGFERAPVASAIAPITTESLHRGTRRCGHKMQAIARALRVQDDI
jgi:hypothetical protein